jgi:CubicO group peptidase (beta-lactamase class C family)
MKAAPKARRFLIPLLLGVIAIAFSGHTAVVPGNELEERSSRKPQATENRQGKVNLSVFPEASPESQGLDSDAINKLVEVVRGYYDSEQIVGAELVIIKNRRTVLHEVFGWRDREDEIPIEKNSIFNIRSMTKPLTGAGIQILIDEGKINLTDRAADYLPGFKNDRSESITIEQLLTHHSGLPLTILTELGGIENLADLADSMLVIYPGLISMANDIGERGPQFEPESKFWYSDAGTDVLGAIIEVVAGRPLDEFFRERLLKPLGMLDTYALTRKDSLRRDRVVSLYIGAVGLWNKAWKPSDRPFYPFAWGSQTLYSTPQDYGRFLAMWMDKGMAEDKRLLSEVAVRRTLTPESIMAALGSDSPMPTGFPGFQVYYGQMAILYADSNETDMNTPAVIGHSGSDGTFAWAWPEHDLMVLYFTQSRGQATGIRLETEIHNLLIDPGGAVEAVSAIPEKYRPYVGKYTANFGPYQNAVFKVLVQNKNLALDVPGQMIFELNEPDEEGLRTFRITNLVSVAFEQDSGGKVTEMEMTQITLFPRKAVLDSIPGDVPEKYQPYLGKYTAPMTNAEFTVFFQEDHLALDVPNERIIELKEPDEKGRWFFDRDDQTAVFFDFDEANSVKTMNLSQTFPSIRKGESAAVIIEKTIKDGGIEESLKKYQELKQSPSNDHFFDERGFNTLGYKLLNEEKIAEAIKIFELNVDAYPDSWNVYDSLGEAYMKNGDKELAMQNYQKSLEMNPENENGKKMLEKLQTEE